MKYRVPVKLSCTLYGVSVVAKDDAEARDLAEDKIATFLSKYAVGGTIKAGKPVWQVPVPRHGRPGRRPSRKHR